MPTIRPIDGTPSLLRYFLDNLANVAIEHAGLASVDGGVHAVSRCVNESSRVVVDGSNWVGRVQVGVEAVWY